MAPKLVRTRKDFTVQTFRCGGPGGQNVNKVETGVRIIDKITGISSECREERNQLQNKERAFMKLLDKVIEYYRTSAPKAEVKEERVRTYKGKTVIDHRLNKMYLLERVMNGELEEIHSSIAAKERIEEQC
jgi:peptide chain release factor 1